MRTAAGVVVLVVVPLLAASAARPQARALRLVEVASGLSAPTYATAAPGEPRRLYIVEKTGRILVR